MSDWQYFTENELRCRGTGDCFMDKNFMKKLVQLREDYDKPMIVSSGYRDISYNTAIGGSPNSAHTHGRAVDILVGGAEAYRLLRLAVIHGIRGIGVSQRGNFNRRFLHLDMMDDSDKHPRPWIWSYK